MSLLSQRLNKCVTESGILDGLRHCIPFAIRMLLYVAALLYCGPVVQATPAADAVYSSVAPDQHMKEWLIVGPIPAREGNAEPNADNARKMGLEQDLLELAGGEAKVSPKPGVTLAARGGELKWRLHESKDDVIDLSDAIGKHDFSVAY